MRGDAPGVLGQGGKVPSTAEIEHRRPPRDRQALGPVLGGAPHGRNQLPTEGVVHDGADGGDTLQAENASGPSPASAIR